MAVDPVGILRAVVSNSTAAAGRRPTITQQLPARSPPVARAKLSRKLYEMLLATKMERELSGLILEIYMNQGLPGPARLRVSRQQRAPYFGKSLKELSIAGAVAMLANFAAKPGQRQPTCRHFDRAPKAPVGECWNA